MVLVEPFLRQRRCHRDGGRLRALTLLTGGALKGRRVIADWPGVKNADLHEQRDLRPTTDLRAVLMGVLKDHLRVEDRALATSVFPGSDGVSPIAGLLA